MSRHKDPPVKRIPISWLRQLIQFWLIAVGLGVIVHYVAWWGRASQFVEAFFYLILLVLFLSLRPVQAFAKSLPKPHQWIFVLFLVLMLVGQVGTRARLTFPFVTWWMYGDAERSSKLMTYDVEGIMADGERVTIQPNRLFTSLGFYRVTHVVSKLNALAKKMSRQPDDELQQEEKGKIIELLHALGKIHNEKYPERSVQSMELVRTSSNVRDGVRQNIVRKTLLKIERVR